MSEIKNERPLPEMPTAHCVMPKKLISANYLKITAGN